MYYYINTPIQREPPKNSNFTYLKLKYTKESGESFFDFLSNSRLFVSASNFINLFSLNTSSGVPIYRQLIDQIKQAIRMQFLNPGDQLPSVRTLASNLQVNPMTISKAFAQLELESVLERKRGVGILVAQQPRGKKLELSIETPLVNFIQKARVQNLDDEAIIMLVQQYLSIHAKE